MLLHDSESEARFRKEIRAWVREAVPRLGPPPPGRDWAAGRSYDSAGQRMPADAGYAGIDWPRERGGLELPQVHGGMGFTWEVDVHLYLKRALLLETSYTSTDAAETVVDSLRSA